MGKIELLAVAAAGIYSPNQIFNGHFREDAVKKEYPLLDLKLPHVLPQTVTTLALHAKKEIKQKLFGYPARALSVDRRVEALAQNPARGPRKGPVVPTARRRLLAASFGP